MDREQLIKFFSDFWKIPITKVSGSLKLDDTEINDFNSIRFYQFIASLESNYKVKIANIDQIYTFDDLLKNARDAE